MVPGGGGRAQEPVLLGFGFFRLGELLPEKTGAPPPMLLVDLSTDSHSAPSVFQLLVRHSITDPFGKGVRVSLRDSGKDICSVIASADYLRIRPGSAGSLFLWEDGKPLLKQFVSGVQKALAEAGRNPSLCWSQLLNRSCHNSSRSPHSYNKVLWQMVLGCLYALCQGRV